MSTADLSPTAAMVLGLLAERPHSAYDLVKRLAGPGLARSFWPVSERTWYREPGRLVDAGLLVVDDTVDPPLYSINDEGRAVLAEVAAEARDRPMSFRSERMAILYATAGGSVEQTTETIRYVREQAFTALQYMADTYRRLAEAGPELTGRAHVSALLGMHFVGTLQHTYEWASEAVAELETLDDDGDREGFARRLWSEIADRAESIVAASGGASPARPRPGSSLRRR